MAKIELRQIECFVAVAEELNFQRAAIRLGMSQPPVTRIVRSLEERVGVPLFTRTTRKVTLTAAGRAYLPEARATLKQISQGIDTARRGARGEVGQLIIGVEPSSIIDLISKSIRAFRERYPLASLEVKPLDTDDQASALRKGEIDAGFIVPLVHDDSIEFERMVSMPLVAALPTAHRLSGRTSLRLEELANEPFVLSPADHKCGLLNKIIEACRAAGFTPRVAQEAHEMQLMLCCIAEGLGVSLLPEYMAGNGKPGIVCLPLMGCTTRLEIALAWRKGTDSPLVRSFAGLVRELRQDPVAAAGSDASRGNGAATIAARRPKSRGRGAGCHGARHPALARRPDRTD